jgi:hypothetical protein
MKPTPHPDPKGASPSPKGKNRNRLILGGIGVAGLGGYLYVRSRSASSSTTPETIEGPATGDYGGTGYWGSPPPSSQVPAGTGSGSNLLPSVQAFTPVGTLVGLGTEPGTSAAGVSVPGMAATSAPPT